MDSASRYAAPWPGIAETRPVFISAKREAMPRIGEADRATGTLDVRTPQTSDSCCRLVAAPRRARQTAWRQAPESPQTTAPRPPYPPAARDDRWIQARCTTWRLEVLGSRVLFGASAAPVSWPYDHEMTNANEIEDLRHPDAAKLLHTPDPARLAYNGPDGFPRVIGLAPVWWTFLMRRAETRENVHDDSASETLFYARVQSTHG